MAGYFYTHRTALAAEPDEMRRNGLSQILIGGTTMLSALNALSMRAIDVVSDYDIKEVKDEGLASIFSEGHAGNMASEFIPQVRPALPISTHVLALPVPIETSDADDNVADKTAEDISLARK